MTALQTCVPARSNALRACLRSLTSSLALPLADLALLIRSHTHGTQETWAPEQPALDAPAGGGERVIALMRNMSLGPANWPPVGSSARAGHESGGAEVVPGLQAGGRGPREGTRRVRACVHGWRRLKNRLLRAVAWRCGLGHGPRERALARVAHFRPAVPIITCP